MKGILRLTATVILTLIVAMPAAAQAVSGSIEGTVRDRASGDPLPGVTVTTRSAALVSGNRIAVTDVAGRYRFPSLPPGVYSVEAELAGFQKTIQENVRVSIDQVITIPLALALPSLEEQILVIADAPLVDVSQSSQSNIIGQEYIERLPLSRNANNLFNYTAGVNNGRAFGGTLDASNLYTLDGVNVSDPGAGGYWILPNVDWLKEVQVAGLGANAEYGGFTGGIFNMVTKSGGNEFQGDVTVYYSDDSLSDENTPDPDLAPTSLESDQDLSVSFGGAFIRDRLWYFISGQEVRYEIQPFGAANTEDTSLSRYLGKLTWQLDNSNTIVGLLDYDGKTEDRRGISSTTLESASVNQDSPNWSYNLTWESIWNSNNFTSVKVTGFDGSDDRLPQNGSALPGRSDADSGIAWQNNAYTRYKDLGRTSVDGSWSIYQPDWFMESSTHSFKLGLQYEVSDYNETRTRNGGFTYYDDSYYCDSLDDYFANPFCGVYSSDWGNEIFLDVELEAINLYVQDSWRIGQFTLNYGLRYSDYTGSFANVPNAYQVDFIDPRIGGVWDVGGRGLTAIRAHWGRYHEDLFVYLFDRDARAGAFTDLEYYDYNFATGEFDDYVGGSSNQAALDPGINHPYMDQYIIGFDQQIGSMASVSVDYVHRETRDIIAMVNTNFDYDALVAPNVPGVAPFPFFDLLSSPENVLINPDGAYRDYDSVQLRFDMRPTDKWLFNGSVVWADLTGNAWASDGYVDEYEDLNGQVNADGKLPGQPEWEVKLSASYDLPLGFRVSGYYRYLSGTYWTPVVQIRGLYFNDRQYVNVEERGSRQLDDRNNFDLRLGWGTNIGATRLNLFLDVLNATNEDTVLLVDDWYGTYRYNFRNHPGGSTFSSRAAFMQPLAIENPRQYRVGVKYTF
jgi:hypothetical protein